MSFRGVRSHCSSAWTVSCLAIGAISGVFEIASELRVPDADGRAAVAAWCHLADPVDLRLRRSFGFAAPIQAALRREPMRGCLIHAHAIEESLNRYLGDQKIAEALGCLLFPAPCDLLTGAAAVPAACERFVVDLDPARPVALPPGFTRVEATSRFAIWRPDGSRH